MLIANQNTSRVNPMMNTGRAHTGRLNPSPYFGIFRDPSELHFHSRDESSGR